MSERHKLGVWLELTSARVQNIKTLYGGESTTYILELCDDWLTWEKEFALLQDANQHTRRDLGEMAEKERELHHKCREQKIVINVAKLLAKSILAEVDLATLKTHAQSFLDATKGEEDDTPTD